MYISIALWRDQTDGHVYREGDRFPFDGRQIPEDRLTALESGQNQAGLRLIQAIEDEVEETEVRTEDAPTEGKEAQETASEESKPEPEKTTPARKTRKRK